LLLHCSISARHGLLREPIFTQESQTVFSAYDPVFSANK
jgi:hypothetical protein